MSVDLLVALVCVPAQRAALAKWAFHRELEIWLEAGKSVNLWWRDDDARSATPELDRLIGLSEDHQVPLTLAVIPDGNLGGLSKRLAPRRLVTTIQHGVDHVDRGGDSGGPSEFRGDASVDVIARLLSEAGARFADFERHCKMLAPPWNRVAQNVAAGARAAGLRGISGFGGFSSSRFGLARVDTHIDLLRWNARARFRGEHRIHFGLTKAMRLRRETRQWGQPIGILTHHLVHDSETWRFLSSFLAQTSSHPAIVWRSIAELAAPPVVADLSTRDILLAKIGPCAASSRR